MNIDPSLSNVENGRINGVSESTIRRWKAKFDDLIPDDVQITSQGISERDPETGSWTKVTWKPQAQVVGVDPEALESVFTGWNPAPQVKSATGAPRVVCAADLQVGKTSTLGGTVELAQRVRESFAGIASLCQEDPPEEIVLVDLGDLIENFQNTSSQAQTNDLTLTEQIRVAWRLLMEGIKLLAPLTPKLTYVAVPSNHGRVRNGPKAPAAGPHDDYGIMVAATIQDICRESPYLQHVSVVIPASLEESLTLDVGNSVLGFVHGHQAGSAQRVGEWWKGQSHGRRSGLHEADILLSGHWHSLNVYQSGDERWVIVAPTSDSGSDWWANLKGETSTPGMLTFSVRGGMWHDLQVV